MEPRHFGSPFSFNTKGYVETVEQDSAPDILAATYNLCVCPEGFRDDLPEFGIPQLEFQSIPLPIKALEGAIQGWEPRANPEIIESALTATEQGSRLVSIEVEG